jgi:hypothetical protein
MARKHGLIALTLCFSLLPALAAAQAARNAHEAAVDNRQIAVDKVKIDRDSQELREFENLLSRLDDAREDRMVTRYQETNSAIHAAMQREMTQARRSVEQAAHEVRQSRREAAGEHQEAAMTGSPRDQWQAADDRHDLRDDRRDRNSQSTRFEEMKRLSALSAGLENDIRRGDRKAMQKNVDLARQFADVMRADLTANGRELVEDRGERREDRRERRTDRR